MSQNATGMLADLSASLAVSAPVMVVLAVLTALAVKHFLADFALQTGYQAANKGRYLHPGGLTHVATHGVLSVAVLAPLTLEPFGLGLGALLVLCAAEIVVHYHIDVVKARLSAGLDPARSWFWIALGFDQLLHGLTYLAMTVYIAAELGL